MTDIITVCSACHGDAWNPKFKDLHPSLPTLAEQLLPEGITLFDVHVSENGSCLFFVDLGHNRATLVIAPGDDPVGRFHQLLKETSMAKEVGMKKGASAKAKAYDEAQDKKRGLKEGSPADLKADKAAMKKFPAKKGK
jgi:hypothetical protein